MSVGSVRWPNADSLANRPGVTTLNNTAAVYRDAGKFPEAIALCERVRDARIARLGPDHPDTLTTLNNLALSYHAAGKVCEAVGLLRAGPATPGSPCWAPTTPTPWPPSTTSPGRTSAGRLPEAIALLERVRDAEIARLGPDHSRHPEHARQPRRGVPGRRQVPRGDRPARAGPRRRDRQARPRPPRHPDHAPQPRRGVPGRRQGPRGDRPVRAGPRRRDRQAGPRPPRHPDHAQQPRAGVPGRRQGPPRRSPCTSGSATPGSPSSAPTTPTPWPRSTTSPWRTGR